MRIANTVNESIVDGPGLRFTIFTQGCPHHCPGCHNPDTHDPQGGQEVSVEELAAMMGKNPLIEGLTLSGGEPFAQAEGFARLAGLLKQGGYEVASYSGYTFEHILASEDPGWQALLRQTDVLVDGPFIQKEKSYELRFRGSRNQRILDVPASLERGKAVEISRGRWVGEF